MNEMVNTPEEVNSEDPPGPTRIPNQFIPVLKSSTLDEVLVAKAVLNSAGIDCFIPDEQVLFLYPFYIHALGGARLLVDRNRYEEACEWLVMGELVSRVDTSLYLQTYDSTFALGEEYAKRRVKEIRTGIISLPVQIATHIYVCIQAVYGTFTTWNKLTSSKDGTCPYCSSENFYAPRFSREVLALTYLFLPVPIPIRSYTAFCFECRQRFYLFKRRRK